MGRFGPGAVGPRPGPRRRSYPERDRPGPRILPRARHWCSSRTGRWRSRTGARTRSGSTPTAAAFAARRAGRARVPESSTGSGDCNAGVAIHCLRSTNPTASRCLPPISPSSRVPGWHPFRRQSTASMTVRWSSSPKPCRWRSTRAAGWSVGPRFYGASIRRTRASTASARPRALRSTSLFPENTRGKPAPSSARARTSPHTVERSTTAGRTR